jgi:folate-binding protein YgfZ
MISPVSGDAYRAARSRAALVDRSDRGRLTMTGADRRSYLQGLLTNDIAALEAGRGCYAAYLTPQGRMIADLFVYELGDAMLLSTAGRTKDVVLARLDEFVFTEDVQVADITGSFTQIGIVGPGAAARLAPRIGLARDALDALPEHGCRRTAFEGETAIVTRTTDAGLPGFDVYAPRAAGERLLGVLAEDTPRLDETTAEAIRIEAGVPLFGRDMDEETIPLEAGIEQRAISFTKGCYVGQEVIVRVLHRGHGRVARRLVRLQLQTSEVPAAATPVVAGGREVGHVTSAAWSPASESAVALAYVQRDFTEPGTPVSVGGSPATVTAPAGATA